ncbi:NAD(P)-dependent oxidoreductase [Heyndrickxia ginsengihumi]|uniref:NAD(P)-dependent oxidoreductase n=2 Tax=Heyndrickxia ginsengihumi TaxID=363870 RepID=A0A6M0P819_9BACI|nr:DUF1932 domain-containing protein [Heyndrickxia ginsengihumi]MBE6185156.1 NAD(P)-dependent oxidoreductase [Bacillus sp. (in: firmicutes)]NEY20816.1 NAD(P)-dependent oxidoreductase [Heyndrickxia ginsengihumi]
MDTTTIPIIGFIGFGEAAFHISKGLRQDGIQAIHAFDVMADHPSAGIKIKERMETAEVNKDNSLEVLIKNCDVIFCATSAKYALEIAQDVANSFMKGKMYIDLNSASPSIKKEVAAVIETVGGLFVDAAVMAPVPPYGHKVPMLVSGTGAAKYELLMKQFGMDITFISETAGISSAMKMFRSIFMKGFTSLLLETLSASHEAGVDKEILASVQETLSGSTIEELANLLITRTAIHAERRVTEMNEVVATLNEMKLDATMAKAVKTKLQSIADMNLKNYFHGNVPTHYSDVLVAISERSTIK